MPDTAAIPTDVETSTEQSDAFSAEREAQFMEIAAEIEGGEPEVAAEPAADETPAADVAEPETETPVEQADDAPDPLADATPFTYTVDGAEKTFDGIRVLTDADGTLQGGIIPPESIKAVQDRLQRADFLEAQDKQRWDEVKQYREITFKGSDGVEHKGLAAVEQYATENAKLGAAVKVLADVIETPEKLIALAYAVQQGDTTELQRLSRELGLVAKEATWKARETWGQAQRQTADRATQEQDRSQITTQAISGAVEHWARAFPALTKDDVAKAVQHFSRVGSSIVRPATPDEAKAAGVKPGELVIDHPVMYEWLQDRADLRASQAKATEQAIAADKENAKKLAAAAKGRSGKKPTPAASTKPAEKEPPKKSNAELWQEQRLRMISGQYESDSADDE